MSNLTKIFDAYINYFKSERNSILKQGSILSFTVDNETLIVGQDTLRVTYSNNEKNAMIAFVPCQISVGSYQREVELKLSIHNVGFDESFSTLHVDGGSLFQYTTMYDFDFSLLPEILTKYLELLKVMKTSQRVSSDHPNIDQAIKTVSDAVELYNKEA